MILPLILIILIIIVLIYYIKQIEPYKNYIDKQIPSYEAIQYIDIPKTFEKNCDEYDEFKEINKNFYTEPKFLFPYDACVSQCMQGIWFGQEHGDHDTNNKRGYLECCKKSCEPIKNRQ